MKRLTPFSYIDDQGRLHMSAADICKQVGLPPTDENLALATKVLVRTLKQLTPDTEVRVLADREDTQNYTVAD